VTDNEVPEAAPISGVTSVGDVFITNVLPVPVCDATDVALPTLVIGPVRLALVITVFAVKAVVAVVANVAVAALPPILRFATGVVDVTTKGAVPSAIVEITWLPVTFPVNARDVPVAAPMFGVTSIGEVFITNVLPVPVCDATDVALPTLVIGPVRLALVVTVDANVAVAAFPPILRLATGVVEVTTSGAVPSAIVEITWLPVTFPVNARDVPVAAPMFGVTSVGDVFITNVLPVPVCDATDVALPTLVIGPVRLALVVTVDANVAVAALPPILRFATGVVDVTTNGAVPVATVEVI